MGKYGLLSETQFGDELSYSGSNWVLPVMSGVGGASFYVVTNQKSNYRRGVSGYNV